MNQSAYLHESFQSEI